MVTQILKGSFVRGAISASNLKNMYKSFMINFENKKWSHKGELFAGVLGSLFVVKN